MSQSEIILTKAKSFIGIKESPMNSNNVEFNTMYYGKPVNGARYPWCCVFIWCIFSLCSLSSLFYDGKKTASCEVLLQWCIKKGYVTTEPKPGDLVFFQFDSDTPADHVGLFNNWNANGTFSSIEGNTSFGNDSNGGEVMLRTRTKNQVKAFAHIPYIVEKPIVEKETYTQKQFIFDVCTIVGVTTAEEALSKTLTISETINNRNPLVTPLERYMKAYSLYSGEIEADKGKTPSFGPKMTKAVENYEKGYLKMNPTGKIPAKGLLWKKALGL